MINLPLTLILGGSFNPVHYGHVYLVREVQRRLAADAVIIIPCGTPPHKQAFTVGGQHRLRMLEVAFDDLPFDIRINSHELVKSGPSYTLETLKELSAELGSKTHFAWLMGMDSFNQLETWYRWRDLFELTCFVIADRPNVSMVEHGLLADYISEKKVDVSQLKGASAGHVCEVDVKALAISSTMLRRKIKQGESIAKYVPPKVLNYMREHQLYQ